MAECDWIILCDHSFYAIPGKLCLIGIFDVIYAGQLPAQHPRAFIGLNIIGEPGEQITQRLEIIGPNGQALTKPNIQDITLSDSGSMQVSIELLGMVLRQYGRHAIEVDLGRGERKSAWFTVTELPSQNQT